MDRTAWTSVGEHLVAARVDDVAILRIDREDTLNALSPMMLPDLAAAIRDQAGGASGLVLTGTGRAFSSGDDLAATADLDRDGFARLIDGFQDLTRAVLDTEVPVVAAINGLVVGGAAELTLACDARIGRPDTYFLFPENSLGLTVSNGSTHLLPRLVGAAALPLVLDGRRIPATEAHRMGLLTDVADDPVTAAVERVRVWRGDGTATAWHLALFRPDRAVVEAAMQREVEAAADIFAAGLPTVGAARFRDRAR